MAALLRRLGVIPVDRSAAIAYVSAVATLIPSAT
jgi:hypothetical protein